MLLSELKQIYKNIKQKETQEAHLLRARLTRLRRRRIHDNTNLRNDHHNTQDGPKYSTWKQFLTLYVGHLRTTTDILRYAQMRMKVYKSFDRNDLERASLDFTTAFYLASQDEKTRKLWIQRATEGVVTRDEIIAINKGLESEEEDSCDENNTYTESEESNTDIPTSNNEETDNEEISRSPIKRYTLNTALGYL